MARVVLPGTSVETISDLKTGQLIRQTSYQNNSADYWEEVKSGAKTKGPPDAWRSPTRYNMWMSTYRKPRIDVRLRSGDQLIRETGVSGDSTVSITIPSVDDGLRIRAEVDALSDLKQQRVNLALAFAERGQTARLLGDTASRIGRSFRAARKGDFRKASHELGVGWRKSTRNWLELQYGWKPLLNDVYGSVQALKERNKPEDWLVTVKGTSAKRSDSISFNEIGRYGYSMVDSHFQGHFVRLDFRPSNTFLHMASSLGLTNPGALLWEKLPYSFVVDWALPIGDWLNAMDAAFGFTFLGGSHSIIRKSKRKIGNGGKPPAKVDYFLVTGGGSVRYVSLDRYPYASPPFPDFPRLKDPASLGHMANGLSLLAEAFGRGRR